MNERIEIEVREDGSRVVKRNLEDMARTAEQAAASLDLMKNALNVIQGTIKQPTNSLQQMRSAITALQSSAKSTGGILDTNNIDFARAALERLKQSTQSFAKEAPKNVGAAIERINLATASLGKQIDKTVAAQQALAAAAARPVAPPPAPVQTGFSFMQEPMKLAGPGWQLEGTFKKTADAAAQASGTIASLAAPTTQFSNAAKVASTSAQQLNLNLGAANQTSFAFMNGMATQAKVINPLAQQYMTVGQVWTKNTQQAQQMAFGFMNAANGARAAGGAAGGAVPPVQSLTQSFFNLTNVLRMVSGYLFLREIKEYIDGWIGIENSIKLSTKTAQEAAAVQDKLFEAAQKTRAPMEDVTRLYRRMSQAQEKLGASQQDMIDVTEGVGMALVVQGTTSTQARGALLQLGQAFGMARVRAQEFNSINENAPRILKAIADNTKDAGGSIDTLRQLILKGKISGKEFFDAFLAALPQLRKEFEDTRPTISQAFTVLDNAIGRFIFNADKGVGASGVFAKAVMGLANNIETVGRVTAALAVGALSIALPLLITKLIGVQATATTAATGLRGLWAAAAAHPLLALAAAILAAASALYIFRDSIVIVKSSGVTLGDVWRAQFQFIADGARSLVNYLKNLFAGEEIKGPSADPILKNLEEQTKNFDPLKYAVPKQKQQLGFMAQMFLDFFNHIKFQLNMFIGMWVTITSVIPLLWNGMWAAIKDKTISGINDQIDKLQNLANTLIVIYNIVDRIKSPFSHIDIPQIRLPHLSNENEGAAEKLGVDIAKAIIKGMGTDYVGNALNDLLKRAEEISRSRQFNAAGGLWRPPDLNVRSSPGTGMGEGDDKELNRFKSKLRQVQDAVDPIGAATRALSDSEDTLTEAVKRGLIPQEEKVRLLDMAREKYFDAMHPLGAYLRELNQETELMKMSKGERVAGMEMMRVEADLKKKGVTLTEEQRTEILKSIEANNLEKQVMNEKERIYQKLLGPQKNLVYGQEALNRMLKDGVISLGQYRRELAELRNAAGQGGFFDGFIANLDAMKNATMSVTSQIGQQVAGVMNQMVQGIGDAIAQGIVYGQNFWDTLGQAANRALAGIISGLIQLGLQMLINYALGQTMGTAAVAGVTAQATAAAAAWAPAAALASLASFGANSGPAMAGIASTIALSKGLALAGGGMAFKTGGEFTVGGAGGPDSQLVAFRATPGENVRVNTPAQARAAEEKQSPNVNVPVKIVNVTDPQAALAALQTTEGERIILNTIEQNPGTIRALLNGGG